MLRAVVVAVFSGVAVTGCGVTYLDSYLCANPDGAHVDANGDSDPCHVRDPDAGTSDAGTDLSCTGKCVPRSPSGWSEPVLLWMGPETAPPPECPSWSPQRYLAGHADLTSPPLSCGVCGCDPPAGSCALPATLTASSAICNISGNTWTSFDPPDAWTGACTQANAIPAGKLCGGVPCTQSLSIAQLTLTESNCTPTLAFEPRVDLDPDRARSTQAQGVDRPTFEELYLEHFDLARNAIRRRGVRRPAEIEELAQEVFIIVYRRLPEVDFARGTGKGWIYRIAVNVALNHLRRPHDRREALMDPAEQETTFAEPGNSEARLADREHLRLLLESTTPERREVYELFEVEGFTLSEVAFALEIPLATADSRLRLARRDMQAANPRLQPRKAVGRMAILPFGTGAWLHLREITKRPPGAVDRLWERIQSTPSADRGAEGDMPAKAAKPSWQRRAATLARRAMEPALGAAFGAAVTLVYVHVTRAPARETTVQPAVMLAEEAETQPAAPGMLNGLTEETSAALLPTSSGADPSKTANPAALLALRKAQAAYVVGDRAAALDALSGFEREFAEDPLRISAERLRALVLRPLAANR